jgi:WS/DGAT/MGAT family acyltransferase
MSRTLNRRLTTTDASFLYFERPGQPLHIGSCNVYDGHVSVEDVVGVLENRLHSLPRYRQKVVFAPFAIAHPTWEDDADFDVRNHVEEIELPAPGDDAALSRAGGAVFVQMLDRRRPLWKLVLLQGHQSGNTHMISMVHHAMVDGVSGVELQMVLHDLTKHPDPTPPPAPWQPQPPADPLTLLQDAVRDRLVDSARIWTDEVFRPFRAREAGRRARQVSNAVTSAAPYLLSPAPRTPFNGPLSGGREFAWVELPFAAVRGIRSVLGGTVNDVVLTILSGALGRYLRSHGQSVTPSLELRAMCPVSVRKEDERGALGNLVSMIIAPLFAGINDPLERLKAERAAMERLKSLDQAGGLNAMTEMADVIPPGMQAFAGRFEVTNSLLNTVSTNVPGPQIPIYMAGRELVGWYPMGPVSMGIGLFVAILSYNQKLTFGATVDPKLVPDVWHFVACLRESFEELAGAAQRVAAEVERGAEQKQPVPAPPIAARNGKSGRTRGRAGEKEATASPRGR